MASATRISLISMVPQGGGRYAWYFTSDLGLRHNFSSRRETMSGNRTAVMVGIIAGMMFAFLAQPAAAQSVLSEKQISLPLAQEAAAAAIEHCRKDGYKVSVTVVDRDGRVKVVLCD